MLTKPTTVEIREAIDTLVNFSMFTESDEIGTTAMKASTLFEKELIQSMKQHQFWTFSKKQYYIRSLM